MIVDDGVRNSPSATSDKIEQEVNAASKEVDEIVLRAWRAAIFG